MKKIVALILCAVLMLCGLPGVAQVIVPCTTQPLSKYAGFSLEEESGEWSVTDPYADAIADLLAEGELRTATNKGFALFSFALSGNQQTGTLRPELVLQFVGKKPMQIQAVTLFFDGTRVDATVSPRKAPPPPEPAANANMNMGRAMDLSRGMEEESPKPVYLPLTDMELAQRLFAAEQVELWLHGADSTYHTVISSAQPEQKSATDERRKAEALSLRCGSLLGELSAMEAEDYCLWDLSEAEWKQTLENETQMRVTAADSVTLWTLEQKGAEVKELQAALAQAGFYAGAAEQTYGAKTAQAVVRAQSFYGLVPTGAADPELIECLQAGQAADAPAPEKDAPAFQALSEAEVAIHRVFCAGRVFASKGDVTGGLCPIDSGNLLLSFDGLIRNTGRKEIGMGWQCTATLTLASGASFACTVNAESDAGAAFTSTLLPMACTRMLITAELPRPALSALSGAVLTISMGESQATYTLD